MAQLDPLADIRELTWQNLSSEGIQALLIYYHNPHVVFLNLDRNPPCRESDLLFDKEMKLPKYFVSEHLTSLSLSHAVRCTTTVLQKIAHHKHLSICTCRARRH